MIRSREVITPSLEHALVANRVLAALASNDLNSEETQEAIKDGLGFLESMITGKEATASRSVGAVGYIDRPPPLAAAKYPLISATRSVSSYAKGERLFAAL